MKKLLFILMPFILMSMFLLIGCDNKYEIIGLKEGDIRTTETEHYIYVEKCSGMNGFNEPFWEYVKIINKDSINKK